MILGEKILLAVAIFIFLLSVSIIVYTHHQVQSKIDRHGTYILVTILGGAIIVGCSLGLVIGRSHRIKREDVTAQLEQTYSLKLTSVNIEYDTVEFAGADGYKCNAEFSKSNGQWLIKKGTIDCVDNSLSNAEQVNSEVNAKIQLNKTNK